MTNYEIFSLFTCLTVFSLLTVICSMLIYNLVRSRIKLIGYGDMDEEIIKEYEESKKHDDKKYKRLSYIVNAVLSLIFIGIFTFSLVFNLKENSFSDNAPTMRVVLSDSMSRKLEGNDYLAKNELNDQFQTYDIILTYKIPDEFELELYDIVVYEIDDKLVVHRIVSIEEPNEQHPNTRHFTLQGDAVGNIDRFPVLYSQMRGIYRGQRIAFAGSFVKFFQSPAGLLCIILLVAVTIFSPLIDNQIDKKKRKRLLELGYITEEPEHTIEPVKEENDLTYENDIALIPSVEDPDLKNINVADHIPDKDSKTEVAEKRINKKFKAKRRKRSAPEKRNRRRRRGK